jgi:hypothetical protein
VPGVATHPVKAAPEPDRRDEEIAWLKARIAELELALAPDVAEGEASSLVAAMVAAEAAARRPLLVSP